MSHKDNPIFEGPESRRNKRHDARPQRHTSIFELIGYAGLAVMTFWLIDYFRSGW
jgi:hypothetical protein